MKAGKPMVKNRKQPFYEIKKNSTRFSEREKGFGMSLQTRVTLKELQEKGFR
jgi:hypothetical protein